MGPDDIHCGIKCTPRKFANNVKLSEQCRQQHWTQQKDGMPSGHLEELKKWANETFMKYNKFRVLYLGHGSLIEEFLQRRIWRFLQINNWT